MAIIPTTRDDKLTLLFYLFIRQMGGMADCLRHIQGDKQNAGYNEDAVKAWIVYLKTELADTSMMIRKMCKTLGIDYESTIELGIARDMEKSKEYLKRHPDAHWI